MLIPIAGGVGFVGQHPARAPSGHELVAFDSLHPRVHLNAQRSHVQFPGSLVERDASIPEGSARLGSRIGSEDRVVDVVAETGTGRSMDDRRGQVRGADG